MSSVEELEKANWDLWVECEAVERELDELSDSLLPVMETDENGTRQWWLNGERQREDGPAVEWADEDREWWLDGELHREDGPAYEGANGSRWWWVNGRRHREDGPAYEGANGIREWYLDGNLHREDGPAREWPDGTREWWLNGKHLSEEEHKQIVELLDV